MPTDEAAHFIMNILGDGGKCGKENIFGEEVDANFDPDDGGKGRHSDYPEDGVKGVTEHSQC